jgi:hypothetical protein
MHPKKPPCKINAEKAEMVMLYYNIYSPLLATKCAKIGSSCIKSSEGTRRT